MERTAKKKRVLELIVSNADLNVTQARKERGLYTSLLKRAHAATLVLSRDEWRQELSQTLQTSSFVFAMQNAMHIENGNKVVDSSKKFLYD